MRTTSNHRVTDIDLEKRRGIGRRFLMQSVVVMSLILTSLVGGGCPEKVESKAVYRRVGNPPLKEETKLTKETKEMHDRASDIRARRKVEMMRVAFVSTNERSCTKDEECSLTNEHCCGCTAMGKMTAIAGKNLGALIQRRAAVCQETKCAMGMSADATCAARTAVCRNNMCVPNPDEVKKGVGGVGIEDISDARASSPKER